jgi:hypothetical protein
MKLRRHSDHPNTVVIPSETHPGPYVPNADMG